MRNEVIDQISQYVEMDRETLLEKGVEAFLRERKRNLMLEKYQIPSRYDVSKTEELEKKIKSGDVKEHPAWEDLIALENLDNAISHLPRGLPVLVISGKSETLFCTFGSVISKPKRGRATINVKSLLP